MFRSGMPRNQLYVKSVAFITEAVSLVCFSEEKYNNLLSRDSVRTGSCPFLCMFEESNCEAEYSPTSSSGKTRELVWQDLVCVQVSTTVSSAVSFTLE